MARVYAHTHTTARAFAALGLAVALTLASAGPAAAAGTEVPPTPNSGPVAGGTTVTGTVPTAMFTQASTTSSLFCALTSNGTIVAWGGNRAGQVGTGTTDLSVWPPQVLTLDANGAPLPAFQSVNCAGSSTAAALDVNGGLWMWVNPQRDPVTGAQTYWDRPVHVTTADDGSALPSKFIAAGGNWAIDANNHLWTWGQNNDGQVGDGTWDNRFAPVQLTTAADGTTTLPTFQSVAYDRWGNVMVGLDTNGHLWTWGNMQAFTGILGSLAPTPLVVPGVTFKSVNSGYGLEFAIDSAGHVWVFGRSNRPGTGAVEYLSGPTQLLTDADNNPLPQFKDAVGNAQSEYLLDVDGNIWAWGTNEEGSTGVNVALPDPTVYLWPTKLLADSSGQALPKFTSLEVNGHDDSAVFAISEAGDVWAWGLDYGGYLWNSSELNVVDYWPAPQTLLHLTTTVTRVTFGGVDGTDLVSNPDGTYTVVNPAGGCGPVDVVVHYDVVMDVYALDAPPIPVGSYSTTYPKGFTYAGATCPTTFITDTGGTPVLTPWAAAVALGMLVTAGLVLGVRRRVA